VLNNGERTFEPDVVAPHGIFEPLLTANLGASSVQVGDDRVVACGSRSFKSREPISAPALLGPAGSGSGHEPMMGNVRSCAPAFARREIWTGQNAIAVVVDPIDIDSSPNDEAKCASVFHRLR
jgi:hypothetical protein